jgi:hypothetical protein
MHRGRPTTVGAREHKERPMGFGPVGYPAYAVIYASHTSIAGQYLVVYGDYDTLTVDYSSVSGDYNKVTGNYNNVSGYAATVTGHDNVIIGAMAVVHGDHNTLQGNMGLIIGNHENIHGQFNHIYGDYENVPGSNNEITGTDQAVIGNGNTVTLLNANGIDPAKISNYIRGEQNIIYDRDDEKVTVVGDFNTLHIAHSDTIELAGKANPGYIIGQETGDTLDFSLAVSGKSDVYGFNATDTIVVRYGETTTVTTLANGFTNLHIAGNGVSYDVVFHDGGADVAAHIVHAFFQV